MGKHRNPLELFQAECDRQRRAAERLLGGIDPTQAGRIAHRIIEGYSEQETYSVLYALARKLLLEEREAEREEPCVRPTDLAAEIKRTLVQGARAMEPTTLRQTIEADLSTTVPPAKEEE